MLPTWSRAEVRARSRRDDAALIIDGVVYDVTQFLESHPGGVEPLLDHLGQDASAVFHDVQHSAGARELLPALAVAELPAAERAPPAAPAPPRPAPARPPKAGSAAGGAWFLLIVMIAVFVTIFRNMKAE